MSGDTASAASLLGLGTWTRQGPATLVVREDRWVVLVPGLRKQVTEAAWEVLGRRPAAEEFVDQLVEAGELGSADKLTALLFGVHDGQTATLGVKGSTPLSVYTADGAQQLVGTEEQPLVVTSFEGVRRLAFGDLPPEEPIGAPRVVSGIVPVRGFVHMTVDPAQLEESERAALAEQVALLAEELGALEVPCRTVSWEYELPLLVDVQQRLGFRTDIHTAVQAHVGGRWVLVDATHDPALGALGLTVGRWDGRSETGPAYQPVGPCVVLGQDGPGSTELQEAMERIGRQVAATRPELITQYRDELNALFEGCRQGREPLPMRDGDGPLASKA